MVILDLTMHDPEEFEGKLISYNGCNYIVGEYLGIGAEKIAHKLINKQSGLCLHVIKIWRDLQTYFPEISEAVGILYNDPEIGKLIPDFVIVEGNGGLYELQNYQGSFEEESLESFLLWEKATKLITEPEVTNRMLSEAALLYKQVLQINPFHTAALNNLASIYLRQGAIQDAFQLIIKVNEIEPNFCSYQRSYIMIAAQCGYPRNCLDQYEYMRTQFVYQHACDELAIDLYLKIGEPEKAKDVFDKSLPILPNRDNWATAIETALATKSLSAREFQVAREFVQEVIKKNAHLKKEMMDEWIGLLEKAYSVYDKDPFVAINLGLALQYAGNYHRSMELLVPMAFVVPFPLIKICYANSAFSAIKSEKYDIAMSLLKATLSQIAIENGGYELKDIWSLPGIAIWVDRGESEATPIIIEEKIESAFELVNLVIERSSGDEVPVAVRRLRDWYRQALVQMRGG